MSTLTTTAWVAHDLGLAAGFGGTLFGKFALNPAVRAIDDKAQRGRLLDAAWRGFQPFNAISFATAALTWLVGRSAISGRAFGRDVRGLVLAKDILLAGAVATNVANMICGRFLGKERPQGAIPVEEGNVPAPETPRRSAVLQRVVGVLSNVNLLCAAGVIATTAILGMKSGRSSRWTALTRLLP
ncbi:MAG TPA: hypothetical protein VH877_14865 [Polyangia bacterium]|nr:hypothetical protein [Polyangia bacterium]